MRKAGVVVVALLVLLSGTAFGYIDAELSSKSIKVQKGEIEYVTVYITSNETNNLNVILDDSTTWAGVINPQIEAVAHEKTSAKVYFSPGYKSVLGTYKMSVIVSSNSESVVLPIFVRVDEGELAVVEKVDVTGDLSPTGSMQAIFTIKNAGDVNIRDITLEGNIISPDGGMYKFHKYVESLDKGDYAEKIVYMDLEEGAPAGRYVIDFTLSRIGREYERSQKEFVVISKPILKHEVQEYGTLFGYGKTVIIENIGNDDAKEVKVSESLSSFDMNFLSGDDPSDVNSNKVTWFVSNIGPGSTGVIEYYIDYTPIVIFLLAMALAGWFVFSKHTTVKVRKYIMQKKKGDEDTEYTIAIEIKNNMGKISGLQVKDFAPGHVKVGRTVGLQPDVTKLHEGTKLVWSVGNMNKGDERILVYKANSVIGVEGLNLPRCRLKFVFKARNFAKKSNVPSGMTFKLPFSLGGAKPVKEDYMPVVKQKKAKPEPVQGPLKMGNKVMKIDKDKPSFMSMIKGISIRKKSPRDQFLEQFELDDQD